MQIFLNILKGLIIGGSMWVPGVSGGTMAILLGCYDDMISAVSSFFKSIRRNTLYLLQIVGGAAVGILLISRLIDKGLQHPLLREPLLCFFTGVVLGGIPFMYRRTKSSLSRKRDYLYLLGGLILVILISLIPENVLNLANGGGPVTVLFLLVAGLVVAVALVLPGISTTLMLAALGLYETVNSAVSELNLPLLVPLGMGLVIGIFATTRFLENLMNRYPRKTYLAIIGFVLGSVYQVLPDRFPTGWGIPLCILALPAGFLAITLVGKAGGKAE